MNNQVKISIISILLGSLIAYVSVWFIGYSATTPVPEFAKSYSTPVITSAIGFIVVGIPLAIIFTIFAQIIQRTTHNNSYLPYALLVLPLFALHILIGVFTGFNFVFFADTLSKYIPIAFCLIYFVKKQGAVKAKQGFKVGH